MGEAKLTKEEKAAKKAKKEEKEAKKAQKRAVEEASAEEVPAKKAKGEETKEEKAARKAAKKAAKEAKAEGSDGDEKAAKKAKKEAKRAAEAAEAAEASTPKAEAAPAPAPAAAEGEAPRVFVGNLPFKMTEDWMKEEFGKAGTISDIDWLMHQDTGRWKGAVFISFGSKAEADNAVATLNGKELEGRPMKVELATPKRAGGGAGGGGFTPSDPGEPSESIFCGNLSWSITEEDLRSTFAPCGEISRIKWLEKDGEFKGIAFIDFPSVEAATKAVALAGTNVAGRPMRINFSKAAGGKKDDGAGGAKWSTNGGSGRVERPYKPQGPKPDGCLELFCGNLPWSIDEAKITTFFAGAGATVSGCRWLNDKETGEFKGIGFIAFETTEDVDKAVALGGEQVDSRPIRIDYAGAGKKKEGAWGGGEKKQSWGGGW